MCGSCFFRTAPLIVIPAKAGIQRSDIVILSEAKNLFMMNSKKVIVIFSSATIFLFFATPALADLGSLPANDKSQENICDLSKLPEPVTEKSVFLPDCVYFEGDTTVVGFDEKTKKDITREMQCGCRNVNVLVDLLVVTANWIFGITGGAALLVFVYGGFVILTAAGGERVKKGKDIIVAAVIGLIIIFTAQVGLKFILSALLKPAPTEQKTDEPATLEGLNIKVKE